MRDGIDPESPLGKRIKQNLEFQAAREEAKRLGLWHWTDSPLFILAAAIVLGFLFMKFIAPPLGDAAVRLMRPLLPRSEPWQGPERLLGNDGLPIPDEHWPKQ